jgi:hypothetical protein
MVNIKIVQHCVSFSSMGLVIFWVFYVAIPPRNCEFSTVSSNPSEEMILKVARMGLKQMRACARQAPHNFLDQAYFLEAEIAAVTGRISDSVTMYRLVIKLAQKEGFHLSRSIVLRALGSDNGVCFEGERNFAPIQTCT